MHPGQFIAHFINTAIITAIVAALVLWRYKVGVLAGMNLGGSLELPIPQAARRALSNASIPGETVLAWERKVRWRIGVAVAGVVLVCSLPLAWLPTATLPGWTPVHL